MALSNIYSHHHVKMQHNDGAVLSVHSRRSMAGNIRPMYDGMVLCISEEGTGTVRFNERTDGRDE